MLIFGLGFLFEFFAYLKRQWLWGAVLFGCCIGTLDLYTNKAMVDKLGLNPGAPAAGFMENMSFNVGAQGGGGLIGATMNHYFFGHFGRPGATIIFVTLYIISLLFLTNFQLGEWLRAAWASRHEKPVENDANWTPEEKALARKARELQRETEKIKQQVEKQKPKSPEKLDPAPTSARTGP